MKRVRLIPSIMLLLLCVGVLCVGIYAANPTSSTLKGKVGLEGANYLVNIETWQVGENGEKLNVKKMENLNGGGKSFTYNNLAIDMAQASTLSDACVTLAIKVTNLSDVELGAFFLNPNNTTINETTGATKANLYPTATIKDPNDSSKDLIDVNLTFYKHIGPKSSDASVITDEATLFIQFSAKDWVYDESYNNLTFDYTLVIEEYKPNMLIEIADMSEGPSEFYKFSTIYEDSEGIEHARTTIGDVGLVDTGGSGFYVVVPNGVTEIVDSVGIYNDVAPCEAFARSGAKYVSLPNSLTSISGGAFYQSDLERIEIPASVTSIDDGALSAGGLKSVYVASESQYYYSKGNCVIGFVSDDASGRTYKRLVVGAANAEVPSDINILGAGAFTYSSNNLNLQINCTELVWIEPYCFDAFGNGFWVDYPNAYGYESNLEILIPDGCVMDAPFDFKWDYWPFYGQKIVFEGTFGGTLSNYDGLIHFEIVEFLSETPDSFTGPMAEVLELLENAGTIYVPAGCGSAYATALQNAGVMAGVISQIVER